MYVIWFIDLITFWVIYIGWNCWKLIHCLSLFFSNYIPQASSRCSSGKGYIVSVNLYPSLLSFLFFLSLSLYTSIGADIVNIYIIFTESHLAKLPWLLNRFSWITLQQFYLSFLMGKLIWFSLEDFTWIFMYVHKISRKQDILL